ncbi:hypothetical protein D3C72_2348430 [compost metagenome]
MRLVMRSEIDPALSGQHAVKQAQVDGDGIGETALRTCRQNDLAPFAALACQVGQ